MSTQRMNKNEAIKALFEMDNSAKHEDWFKFSVWLHKAGIPLKLNLFFVDLWEKTQKIGGKLVSIGKIVCLKVVEFVKSHKYAVTGMAIGAALFALASQIPYIGWLIPPYSELFGVIVGGIKGAQLDHPQAQGIIQVLICLAEDFFKSLTNMFKAIFAKTEC